MHGGGQDSGFRAGDEAEVRTAREILATLDEDGTLEAVPFMPEMLEHIGKRYPVYKRLEKICDYFSGEPSRARFIPSAVVLSDLRCDGSAHGGCMARCRYFWKEAWLRSPGSTPPPPDPEAEAAAREELERRVRAATRVERVVDEHPEQVWRCQITEAIRASTPVGEADPRRFLRELTSRNVTLWQFTRVAFRAVTERIGRKLRLVPEFGIKVAGADRVAGDMLDLKPGEVVEVRSREEIARTLDESARLRGLVYTAEMNPACGKRFQVKERIERLIDERNGRMIEIKSDCVTLEGFICTGEHTRGAWFCAREHYPIWREAWLKRAEQPVAGGAQDDASTSPTSASRATSDA